MAGKLTSTKNKSGFDLPVSKPYPGGTSTITPTTSAERGPAQGSFKASDQHKGGKKSK